MREVGSILQASWKEVLGIDVELANQEWPVNFDFESENAPDIILVEDEAIGKPDMVWVPAPIILEALAEQNEMLPLYTTYMDPYLLSSANSIFDDEPPEEWFLYSKIPWSSIEKLPVYPPTFGRRVDRTVHGHCHAGQTGF